MEAKDRIKELRKSIGISQPEFAKKISISKGYIANLELGDRKINDRMIKLICQEFDVNEDWLRYGIGEMFNADPDDILEELEKQYDIGEVFKNAIKVYLRANELTKKMIDDYLQEVVEETNKSSDIKE